MIALRLSSVSRPSVAPARACKPVVVVRAFLDGEEVRPVAASTPRKPRKVSKATLPRAPTAFQLYQKEGFAAVVRENPDVKAFAERARLVRKAWEALEASAKAPFEEKAATLKAEVDAQRVRGHAGGRAGISC